MDCMSSIKLFFGPAFSPVTKKINDILNFDNEMELKDLLDYLYEKFGDKFKELVWDKNNEKEFHKQLVIIINGRTYRDDNFLETPLKDGDDISFIYEYFGG